MTYPEDYINKIIQGDCLEVIKGIPDKSIDMILCDLPYGITACSWDTVIPFKPLWEAYKRIIKENGAIVLTGNQPFTSNLIVSNIDWFRYELVWLKKRPSNVFNANKMFMKWHENIVIFYNKLPTFNPIMVKGKEYVKKQKNIPSKDSVYGKTGVKEGFISSNNGLFHPKTVIEVTNDNHNSVHPTQKPVALFEYLIKTYTNEGELVLDNCIGSGTTAVACKNLKRNFIGIEISEDYCKIARERLKQQILL